ncbi:MAG: methionine gamma-lyase family protein [Clostridia bacterium]|nr:methionine gamma-lyase family protein [Clostridia bacterium]
MEKKLTELVNSVQEEIKPVFEEIDKICEYNSKKVLTAFQENHVSEMHFNSTSGYGYGDVGRDTIENIFAKVLGAEDALVRAQFISGTHALTVCLFGLLRPGDTVLSINGKPYDTLDSVIGIEENPCSLKSYNINYEQIDLIGNNFNYKAIEERVAKKDIKLVIMQRSRGYDLRKSLSLENIKKVVETIRKVNLDVWIMCDNCYGEFVDTEEPLSMGVDVIVGSLIKNLGGGIAPNGGYIAGKKELVELCSQRLTAPGLGKEVGPTLGINRSFLQGLFMAPSVVASSLKTAVFASRALEKLGYVVEPSYNEKRSDIVQTIRFGNPELLIKFCQGIQMGSPIDSNTIPEPWDMPGYTDKVIMAAGTFTAGSSIELSCDAPIREPFVAFLQGGLTYEYGKLGVIKAIENILKEK